MTDDDQLQIFILHAFGTCPLLAKVFLYNSLSIKLRDRDEISFMSRLFHDHAQYQTDPSSEYQNN